MEKATTYICGVCGAKFESEAECLACENGHKIPANIVERRYVPIKEDEKGFPHTMCMEFNDGSRAVYKFAMQVKDDTNLTKSNQ